MNFNKISSFMLILTTILVLSVLVIAVAHNLVVRDVSANMSRTVVVTTSSATPTDTSADTTENIEESSISEHVHTTMLAETVSTTVQPEPSCYINLSDAEIVELASLVYLESGGESYECQLAVASCIINRMTTTKSSLSDVIYAPNQFSPAHLVPYTDPSESTVSAVRCVVADGPTLPEYVTYFRADHYHNWGNRYKHYIQIDNTYFSYDVYLKEKLD